MKKNKKIALIICILLVICSFVGVLIYYNATAKQYKEQQYLQIDGYDDILTTNEPLKFNVSPSTLSHIIDSCLTIQSDKISNEIKLFQSKLLANRLLNKFIESTSPLPSTYPEWLTQLLFALSNPKFEFDTKKLTEITGYSYSHLSRIFKEFMGVSIIEYMRKIKLNYATDLLKNTDLNIVEIVFALNYNSVSYFNHSFKEYYGITPTQMRKQKSL